MRIATQNTLHTNIELKKKLLACAIHSPRRMKGNVNTVKRPEMKLLFINAGSSWKTKTSGAGTVPD